MRVVIAPDSFKGSIGAADAATAIAAGWRAVRTSDEIVLLPQADGGEGTLEVIAAAVPGSQLVDVGAVTGPDGRPTPGLWLRLPDGSGVVELAQMSGLPLMERLSPLRATTRGLGQVIASAVDTGVTSLLICLGGSASTDGGAGALSELGLRMLDASGNRVLDGGGGLSSIAFVVASGLRAAPAGGVRLLTDVEAPLLGPAGAAAVFGPQKGATVEDVAGLELGLAHWAKLIGPGAAEAPGAGAAGGTAFGFLALWSATVVAGAPEMSRLTGLGAQVADAAVVITGEGRFDVTSSQGKVAGSVVAAIPPSATGFVIAGRIDPGVRFATNVTGLDLTEMSGSSEAAMSDPGTWLTRAAEQAAAQFSQRLRGRVSPHPAMSPDWARHR